MYTLLFNSLEFNSNVLFCQPRRVVVTLLAANRLSLMPARISQYLKSISSLIAFLPQIRSVIRARSTLNGGWNGNGNGIARQKVGGLLARCPDAVILAVTVCGPVATQLNGKWTKSVVTSGVDVGGCFECFHSLSLSLSLSLSVTLSIGCTRPLVWVDFVCALSELTPPIATMLKLQLISTSI